MSRRQQTISVMVLAVWTGLPVAGSVCALVCNSTVTATGSEATASVHHGSGANCPQRDSAEVQIRGVSDHDCGSHDGTLREVSATVAAVRADWGLVSAPLAIAVAHTPFKILAAFEPESAYSPPPGTAPPTRSSVLRV